MKPSPISRVLVAAAFLAALAHPSSAAEDRRPHVVRYAPAGYTEAARRARIQGTVAIAVVIASDGTVLRSRLTHDLPMGLGKAGLLAVESWRFNPSPVSRRRASIEFQFSLDPQEVRQPRFQFEAPYRMHSWAPSQLLDERRTLCNVQAQR